MDLLCYQDEYCVLANKPNNVLVHHAFHSRNKREEISLLQMLKNELGTPFYPVHRLDRKTSGIILLTKKQEHVAKFQSLFTQQLIQKTYYAVVRGHTPEKCIIDSPVKGRDSEVYKEAETVLETLAHIELDVPVKPYKM